MGTRKGKDIMVRKLEVLSLALAAFAALNALAACTASAAGERFHSEVEPTIVTAANTNTFVFSSSGASTECTTIVFKGTMRVRTEATWTMHPGYAGCTFLGEPATVDTAGCNYVFGAETASSVIPVEIECTAGAAMKVTSPGCTLTFGGQKLTGGVSVTNEGSGSTRDSRVVWEVGTTFSKSGSLCFLFSGTTGTLKGTTTVKGFIDNGVSGNIDEGATYTEGAQVGIWWE
jgi:hypothetical protein